MAAPPGRQIEALPDESTGPVSGGYKWLSGRGGDRTDAHAMPCWSSTVPGKTTTIRMLLGMITPTGGEVHLFGQSVTVAAQQIWARTGYLVESPAAYPELSVRQNLTVTARLKRLPALAVEQVIDRLGAQPYATRRHV